MTEFVDWVVSLPDPLVWLALFAAAGIEYVFPPFPGDVIVLAGSVLMGSQGYNVVPVFVAVTAGSTLGAWADYELGRWLARPGTTFLHRWFDRPAVSRTVRRMKAGFAKHGDFYLVINRFLPGVRAFFFVAAGMAGFRRARTMVIATLAALLWNGMIVLVGLAIGTNLEDLIAFADRYFRMAWLIVVLAALFLLVRLVWRIRRRGGGQSV